MVCFNYLVIVIFLKQNNASFFLVETLRVFICMSSLLPLQRLVLSPSFVGVLML